MTIDGGFVWLEDAERKGLALRRSDFHGNANSRLAVVERISPVLRRGMRDGDDRGKLNALNGLIGVFKRVLPFAIGANIRAGLHRLKKIAVRSVDELGREAQRLWKLAYYAGDSHVGSEDIPGSGSARIRRAQMAQFRRMAQHHLSCNKIRNGHIHRMVELRQKPGARDHDASVSRLLADFGKDGPVIQWEKISMRTPILPAERRRVIPPLYCFCSGPAK